MWKRWFCLSLATVILLTVGWAQTGENGSGKNDDPIILLVEFDAATVGDVLSLLFSEAQVEYSATQDILASPVGRIRLTKRRVSEILNYIVQQVPGLHWRRDESGVYILTRRPFEQKPAPEPEKEKLKEEPKEEPMLPTPPRVVSPEEWQQRFEGNVDFRYEIVRLRHLPVPEVCYLLNIPVQGTSSSYQYGYELLANLRHRITQPPLSNPSDLANSMGRGLSTFTPTISTPTLPVPETAGQFGIGRGMGIAGMGGIGGLGGMGGMGVGGMGMPGMGMPGMGMPGIGAPGVGAPGVGVGILGLIPGLQQVIGLPTQNALLVYGTPEAIRQLRDILAMIDIPPDQVEIESQFVAVTGSLSDILGIDWRVAGREITIVTQGMPMAPLVQIGYVRGNFEAMMGTILATHRGKIIQAPRAFTMNGLPAIFASTIYRPVIIQVQTTDLAGNVRTITTIMPVMLPVFLSVTPFITEDDTVTMTVMPNVTDVIGEFPNPAGGTIPIVNTTFTFAVVRVRDGESVAIGGLLTTRDSVTVREVPLLARLPIIGSLFRGKDRTVSEQNLIIFVTPRIIRAEEGMPTG